MPQSIKPKNNNFLNTNGIYHGVGTARKLLSDLLSNFTPIKVIDYVVSSATNSIIISGLSGDNFKIILQAKTVTNAMALRMRVNGEIGNYYLFMRNGVFGTSSTAGVGHLTAENYNSYNISYFEVGVFQQNESSIAEIRLTKDSSNNLQYLSASANGYPAPMYLFNYGGYTYGGRFSDINSITIYTTDGSNIKVGTRIRIYKES